MAQRTPHEGHRETRLCSEPGCRQPVWPGSRFCAWHPGLRLAPETPTVNRQIRGHQDPWENARAAHERIAS